MDSTFQHQVETPINPAVPFASQPHHIRTLVSQEAQLEGSFNYVRGRDVLSSGACGPRNLGTDATSASSAFIPGDDTSWQCGGLSQNQTFLDQMLQQWQTDGPDVPVIQQHGQPDVNNPGSGHSRGMQPESAIPTRSSLCYTPPPFQHGGHTSSNSAPRCDCHMLVLDSHENREPQFHPPLRSRKLATPLSTPTNSPEVPPRMAIASDNNEWTPNRLDGGVGSRRLFPEAFPEGHGVGSDDMLDVSLPELDGFGFQAFSGLDGMDGSFSSQHATEPREPSSTCNQITAGISPGFASLKDLSEGPLPSIFDDVDLRSFRVPHPAAVHGKIGMQNHIHAGQATASACLQNPGSRSLRQPSGRPHQTILNADRTPDAADMSYVQDILRPSTGHTWDGSMQPASGSITLISKAEAVSAANAERCPTLNAADWQQQQTEAPSRLLVVKQESQLIRLLHTLAQPVTHSSQRLVPLREINRLRGVTSRTSRYRALYYKNLRDLCPTRRWLQLCPCLAPALMSRSMDTVEAWCEGRLPAAAGDTIVAPSTSLFKPAPLAELATVPISAWPNFIGHLLAQMVNTQSFSRRPGDAMQRRSEQLVAFLTSMWFYVAALSFDHTDAIQAMEGHGFDAAARYREDAPTQASSQTNMLDMLKLNGQQQKLAKGIWKEWHEGLAQAKQERQHILSEMQASGAAASMQRGMRPDKFSETRDLLEQAAALAENGAIQQEITLHCQHRFVLQVCTPESTARIFAAAWPLYPDKTDLLRQVVEAL